jgi:hypothetical protein
MIRRAARVGAAGTTPAEFSRGPEHALRALVETAALFVASPNLRRSNFWAAPADIKSRLYLRNHCKCNRVAGSETLTRGAACDSLCVKPVKHMLALHITHHLL